jgi:DNA-directed RNA polymerase subunit N (RpoN/RPB10)
MYPLVVCYCGRSLADLFDLFIELRKRKLQASFGDRDIDPDVLAFSDTLQVKTGDILDKLNLRLDCCRGHMISQVEFYDLYGR